MKDPSPEMLGQAQDSFEEDEDEYNADSPEHEQKLLYQARGVEPADENKARAKMRQNFKSTDNLN